MRTRFLDLICFGVLCVILTLGLWPFHSPQNDVAWLGNRNGLRFGKYSTAISSAAFATTEPDSRAPASVEIWLKPRRIWDTSTFLAFYTPGNRSSFALRQSEAGLELQAGVPGGPPPPKAVRLYVRNVFRQSGRVFLTITSGVYGTAVYTDGVLAKAAPQLRLPRKALTGRLVVGDSPGQPDSWSGELLGLAIYLRELTAPEVQRHYEAWTRRDRPEISEDERNIALYLFSERTGNTTHDHARSGVDLYFPEKYLVWDKIFLEPFWKEFSMSRSYWDAALKNIVGFIPFGFCLYAALSARKVKHPVSATVLLGALVSITIEVLQACLPTRDSGTTDIFTNTFGTYVGVVSYATFAPLLAARFPWLPFVVLPRR